MIRPLIFAALIAIQTGRAVDPETADPAAFEFFENNVRPLLVEHCYKCHGPQSEKPGGGLRLDTKDSIRRGGGRGPALVPGNPDASLLLEAVRYTDSDLQMPPKDKQLAPELIAVLEHWIRLGAPDPRTGSPLAPVAPKSHWAFQPISHPTPPPVQNQPWVENPVDAFVLARLEENRLTPSPRADKRSLARRAAFDLLGMPPTAEQVAAFLADDSPRAWANLIDRFLADPRYGERWARHWLDVARYADTKGYVFEEERRYPYAYTYRDYVIRAFNEDLPFNRFILEQLAADHLDLGEDKRPVAALGFLTLGRRFLNNQHDIIDDRIDVTTRGLMGLTVGCARCHDHKFDPVPIEDYYSLYGVFASSMEPDDKPLLGSAALPAQYPAYAKEREKRQREFTEFVTKKDEEVTAELRQRAGEYLLAAHDAQRLEDRGKAEALARERKLDPSTVQRWNARLEQWAVPTNAVFGLWQAAAALAAPDFPSQFKQILATSDAAKQANPLLLQALTESTPPQSLKEVAERYGKIFRAIEQAWQEHQLAASSNSVAAAPFTEIHREELRQVLYGHNSPALVPSGEITRLYDVPSIQKRRALQRRVDELDATHPGAPPRAMALVDRSQPVTPRVFVRGNASNPGREVPRQFLAALSGPERKPFEKGSGRLELAQAIASPDNPLTARVIANRVWLYHFGAGLVRTPSDFGTRSDPPTHPELLDYLARHLIDHSWSLKSLHRLILLSNTYQQHSRFRADCSSVDPYNRWLWRMNRQRLDFEATRDSLLAVADTLEWRSGGHAADITSAPFNHRRSVYGFIDRQNLPGLFRTFDFASPDATASQRFNTTVPQQALFMLNSPFVLEQARALALRLDSIPPAETDERIQALYLRAYQRPASAAELVLAKNFLQAQSAVPPLVIPASAWSYGYGHFDEEQRQLRSFTPLPHFNGKAWQGSDKLPDPKLGWVLLNAEGGHPGENDRLAVIRRWTAPQDGQLHIRGALSHSSDQGDGVRAWILSGQNSWGSWTAFNSTAPIALAARPIRAGDTVDFVVTPGATVNSDSFNWAPELELIPAAGEPLHWHATNDFSGPTEKPNPLTPWEKLAQVILMSNELAFAD